MKKFIAGFLVGAMLFSIVPISAAIEEYICYKADYKVVINGEEYISEDLPILNYKGNTYAPFRSILEKAGLNVAWNAELGQAEVTSNPTGTQNDNVEGTRMSIEYDLKTKLPIGAEVIEYKGCKAAVRWNDNIYISLHDLSSKFGIKAVYMNVREHTQTFMKDDDIIVVDMQEEGNRFLNTLGEAYYNSILFTELIGE